MNASASGADVDPRVEWRFPAPFGWRTALIAIAAFMILWRTGADVEIDRAAFQTAQGVAASVGLAKESQVARGFGTVLRRMFPPQLAETTEIARIEGFDPDRLPLFAQSRRKQ